MLALLRNQKVRGVLFQFLTVVGLVAFLWYIGNNTVANIEQRGIQTGFDFLNGTAGFGIDQSPISYTEEDTHGRVFWVGLLNTLIIAFVGDAHDCCCGCGYRRSISIGRYFSSWTCFTFTDYSKH